MARRGIILVQARNQCVRPAVGSHGRDIRKMTDEQEKPPAATDDVVRRLVNKTGITEAQARELVAFLGRNNWTSLLREAGILNPKP
ncbi:hypothetical protein A9174_16380 [Mesorhizobium loti NZP2037]|nr:hypothetical protein A9174_16380 [Mesorhizobium loti NZP2037]